MINSGSSSIKFSVFSGEPRALFTGQIDGIGGAKLEFTFCDAQGRELATAPKENADPLELLTGAISGAGVGSIDAVGYRVVHPGARLHEHQRITEDVLKDLEQAVAFAPLHDPEAIKLIRAMMARFPQARHYACFDTVFHETMPAAASTYPIPLEYREQGVRRYGFHGLSYESVIDQMQSQAELPRRMVIAHLGSGCSVTALLDGRSVDTSMGLTPTGGVVMGTRPGDLDPGLVLYLLRQAEGDRDQAVDSVEALLNHQSGMVALSGLPNDMRAVRKSGSTEARLALDIFVRSVRKAIGAYAWLSSGLDAVVFTGGIGEHDAQSRAEILSELDSYGIALDSAANAAEGDGMRRISSAQSAVAVWVVPAQEDRMITVHVLQMEHNAL